MENTLQDENGKAVSLKASHTSTEGMTARVNVLVTAKAQSAYTEKTVLEDFLTFDIS